MEHTRQTALQMRLLCVCLSAAILCFLPSSVRSANQEISSRLEKALQDARSITKVEVQVVNLLWLKGRKDAPADFVQDYNLTNELLYIASGEKYRTECHSGSSSTNCIKFYQTSFDGVSFSGLNVDTGYMGRHDKDEPCDLSINPLNPLVAPFMFLSKESDKRMGRLRFTDLSSSNILSELTLPNGQSSDGVLQIDFPGPSLGGHVSLWKISIADSGDGFTPTTIRRVVVSGSETTYTLSGYTNLGRYCFPSVMAYSVAVYPPTSPPMLLLTGLTTVVSMDLPKQIPDSMFSLDEGLAKTIWNPGKFVPNGTKAPDIEMEGLPNGASEHLSDYTGKLVVLEFWGTWCVPCQPKMADLQSYFTKYPDWKGNVAIIAAAIDDNKDVVARHLIARGWYKTHNVWVGTEGRKNYHINAIPTVYVIDRAGKILAANPSDLPDLVAHEVQKKQDIKAK